MLAVLPSLNPRNLDRYSLDAKQPLSKSLSSESISTSRHFSGIDKSGLSQISFGIQTPLKSLSIIGKIKNAQQVVAAGHGEKSVKISQHAFLSGHYSG
jgi:hypothetical protein